MAVATEAATGSRTHLFAEGAAEVVALLPLSIPYPP